MNITHCPYGYFPSISGAEFYFQQISEILVRRNHKLKVFCSNAIDFAAFRNPQGKKILKIHDIINNVEIKRFETKYPILMKLIGINPNPELKDLLKSIKFMKLNLIDVLMFLKNGPFLPDMFRELMIQEADIIHTTAIPYFNIVLALLAGKLKSIPSICTPFYHFENIRYQNTAYTNILGCFDRILVCSKAEKDYLLKKGVNSRKIKQIHMGVDLKKYERAKEKWFFDHYDISGPKILFCGYKNEEKGALNILNCIKYVVSKIPNAKFIFIGPSTKGFNIKKRKMGKLRKNIINIGVLPYYATIKRGAFAACDIYVMPSRSEAFGIAYLEAWASKKPVIGADINASIINDGYDGFVIPFDAKPKLLANKIIQLIKDEDLRIKLGINGYNKIKEKNWTLEHLGLKIEEIYKEMLNENEN
ncbi:MAG: glycosyltransferase family 4 protein [Candidatus Helarchaeota archaeon]